MSRLCSPSSRFQASNLDTDIMQNLCVSDSPDPRDELGRCIRHAARLASLLAVTPHHPTLLELLRDITLDIEHLWLIADESENRGDDQ